MGKTLEDQKFEIGTESYRNTYYADILTSETSQNGKENRARANNETIINTTKDLFLRLGAASGISTEGVLEPSKITYRAATASQEDIRGQVKEYCDKNDIHGVSKRDYIYKNVISKLQSNKAPAYESRPLTSRVESVIPLTSLVGSGAAALYSADSKSVVNFGLEAFGATANSVQHDNITALRLQTFQLKNSVIDRCLRRDAVNTTTITYLQANGEIYDLHRSRSPNPVDRVYDHVALIDTKAERSDVLDTTAHRVELLPDNDPDGKYLWKGKANNLKLPFKGNIMTLSLNKNVIGDGIDYTDLLSEGATIDTVTLSISDGSNTSFVKVITKPLTGAMFTASPNSTDSGTQTANFQQGVALNSKTLDSETGVAATALATLTDCTLYVSLDMTGNVNIKFGNLSISGTASLDDAYLRDDMNLEIRDENDPRLQILKKLTITPVSCTTDFRWSEENLRKTTTTVRVNESQRQINIPVGKSYFVELSIAQAPEDLTLKLTGDAISIGNDTRGISVINDRLEATYDITSSTNMILAMNDSILRSNISIAWSLSRPYVIKDSLDLSDTKNYANLKQSELLSDIQSRVTQTLLKNLAILGGKTLYSTALAPGEQVVYKLIGYGPLVDLVLGIPQYHATLDDVTRVDNDSDADLIITLKNGIRLEIVKTYFTKWMNKFLIFPVRKEEKENDVLSFGAIKDAGMFAADFVYTGSVTGSTSRRFVSNSRAFPVITNSMGMILELPNWTEILTKLNLINTMGESLQQIAGGNKGDANDGTNGGSNSSGTGTGTGTGTGGSGSGTGTGGNSGSGNSSTGGGSSTPGNSGTSSGTGGSKSK